MWVNIFHFYICNVVDCEFVSLQIYNIAVGRAEQQVIFMGSACDIPRMASQQEKYVVERVQ